MANFFTSLGVVGYFIGVYFLYYGFTMDVSVSGYGATPVANMQLMQVQMIHFMLGIGGILQGTVSLIGGALLQQKRSVD